MGQIRNPALFQNPGDFEKNICRVFLDNCQLARYNKSDMDYSGPEFPGPGPSFITGVEAGVCVLRLVAFCRYKEAKQADFPGKAELLRKVAVASPFSRLAG